MNNNTLEWKVNASELAESLLSDFCLGPIVNDKGQRFLQEVEVARVDGLKIEIFSCEHPPPHFRVIYAGETANFTIKDCSKLNGDLEKWERNIKKWHKEHKADLISVWNSARPSGCPVGEYSD